MPVFTVTVAEAPAASAPTAEVPATVPFRLTATVVAGEAAVPALRTVALTLTASFSDGEVGVQLRSVSVRSGLGAAVPTTSTSAICPPGAPELALSASRRSAARPETGMVTVFLFPAGLKS